jgi:thiamine pyrophosphate-dependent acetolactate synthase large subunit-like protein
LQKADWVLVFGSSLDHFTTADGAMFPNARVIRFDRDPAAENAGSVPAELFIQGDANSSASALADELDRRGNKAVGFRFRGTADKIASWEPRPLFDEGRPGAVDPRLAMQRIETVLPRDRTLVVDGGHHMMFSIEHLSTPDPTAFVLPLEFYSIGLATGIALGAAIARPDRLTVYDAGDAGLMMTLAEVETAARYNLPLLILVSNDSALGAEVHILELWGLPGDLARVSTPSFEAVAQALGADGLTIEVLDDIEKLRGRVEQLERPLVVDIRITTDVQSLDFLRDEIEWARLRERNAAPGAS